MNVQDVITRVKRSFGDESAVQLTDEDIIRYINDAQRDIVMHNETLLEAIALIDLITGQKEYDFPTDLMILRSARIKTHDMLSYEYLKPYSLHAFDNFIDGWDGTAHGEGSPYIYTTYERKIFVFPTPDTDETEGLKVLYSKKPVDVALITDLLSIPDTYHTSIVKYCMSEATVMDEELEAAAYHRTQFQINVDKLSYQAESGPQETYPTIYARPEDDW